MQTDPINLFIKQPFIIKEFKNGFTVTLVVLKALGSPLLLYKTIISKLKFSKMGLQLF